MRETSKSRPFRELFRDFEKYLHGDGIDIGAGHDVLQIQMGQVRRWDIEDGDAKILNGIPDNSFDFVYSSHCLEHLDNIEVAIKNWSRVIKPPGYLYLTVPDYKLYEKCKWPSMFSDHLFSFSIDIEKKETGRSNHFNIKENLFPVLTQNSIAPIEVRLENYGYNYLLPDNIDQTNMGNGCSAVIQICIIGQKLC
uniref:Methyltransferase type 11 n=1 Tax=uncultured microorganism TaxID=358574 RepID=F8UGX3_9ZZZZ|nr:methyltransferase type 11 [uncultured microorganism]